MKRRKRRTIRRRMPRIPNYGRQIMDMGMGTAGALIGLSVADAVIKKF